MILYRFKSKSPFQTQRIGKVLGRGLRKGDVVCLVGMLGSGKTTLVRGIARGRGIRGYVNSPSFKLINEYAKRIPLFHFDLYRLPDISAVESLGYREYFYGKGITVVEWAEKIRPLWERIEKRIEIYLSRAGNSSRDIRIRSYRALKVK